MRLDIPKFCAIEWGSGNLGKSCNAPGIILACD